MPIIEQKNLCTPIYDQVKRMILNQELLPGTKITQEKLAAELGVSRTPLLRALQMLESDLLVESIPRRGMFVRQISFKEMIDVYYCRESIECMAVRLATTHANKSELKNLHKLFEAFTTGEKIDEEAYRYADECFHNTLIDLCGNTVLKKMSQISQILSQVYSIGLVRTPEETVAEHLAIIAAMLREDAKEAEEMMRKHIFESREVLIKNSAT